VECIGESCRIIHTTDNDLIQTGRLVLGKAFQYMLGCAYSRMALHEVISHESFHGRPILLCIGIVEVLLIELGAGQLQISGMMRTAQNKAQCTP
jgi:hypothetical protein